ncbi:uncharacterized protein LOC127362525 [Xyrichtys novacula]|uniref:Uncharacterized protein LOC127362525 n=1 Tax=Xyrichtys novacula TaxID=13765 RepID=A0AAV1FV91_XYRNO|nr:uncharacterized protein LOC127362525 [Xyrichtys novacula]
MAKSALKALHHPHENPPVDRKDPNKEHTSPSKTSISPMIPGVLTDSVPPTGMAHTEMNDKISCKTVGCAKRGELSQTTTETAVIVHTAAEKMFKMQTAYMRRDHFSASKSPGRRLENPKCSTNCPALGEATPEADMPSASTSTDETQTYTVNSTSDETSAKTWGVTVDSDHSEGQGILQQAEFAEKTTQRHSHRETFETAEVTLSGPEATVVKAIEQILPSGNNTKRQSNKGAGAEVSETQTAIRLTHSLSKGEMAFTESEHKMFLPQRASESEGRRRKQERSSHRVYLSG